jgi:hypothetical protein
MIGVRSPDRPDRFRAICSRRVGSSLSRRAEDGGVTADGRADRSLSAPRVARFGPPPRGDEALPRPDASD